MALTDKQRDLAARISKEASGEILRLDPDVKGFLVVLQRPEDPSPVLYRVTLEKHTDGSESLHWAFLGSVDQSETDSFEG